MAAEALLPVASHLAVADAAAVVQLRSMLWDILLDVEELSPSTGVSTCFYGIFSRKADSGMFCVRSNVGSTLVRGVCTL